MPPSKAAEDAGAHLLAAALESMPYGFSVWSHDLRLILWNDRYPALYGMPAAKLHVGMTLGEICALTVAIGNHPGMTAEGLRALYRSRHAAHMDPAKPPGRYEKDIRGRIIRTTYIPRPGIGHIVVHEDITDDVQRVRHLEAREAELELQNIRFNAVIENLNQGICLFNSERRLVICNTNYAQMYNLPADLVQPGATLEDILRYRVEHGLHPVGGKDAYMRRRLDLAANAKPDLDIVELLDGRVIAITHEPTPDGGWVSTHRDITEQRRSEERIRHIARHDSLTDLPNRHHFREIMGTALQRIAKGEQLALLAVDLDRFKQVNDSLGHGAGDSVLRTTADRLRECCRGDDVVARIGGDEFAILAGSLQGRNDAANLAARIVERMAQPMDIDGRQIVLGASVGVAIAPTDGSNDEQLVHSADLALYRAKSERRSGFQFFESSLDDAAQRRRALESDLRSALSNNEFRLVFQPIFNLAERRIVCFEALLRWDHPRNGTISPADFIPVAEDTGLIGPIGRWALDEACRAAADWPDDVSVAVNLSTAQFRDRDLVAGVRASLEMSDLPMRRLNLEVTESLLLTDAETTLEMLHALRAGGIRISLDDFGTGFSSLSYLRSFPFDKIKIDKSFIETLTDSTGSRAIVSAVIDLGRSLGIATTAEGVETGDQLDMLLRQGCSEVQGFLFSPPLPAAAAGKLLTNRLPALDWARMLDREPAYAIGLA
jgi:diguanylate cyclase (GGDEF)-like protein